MSQLIPLRTKPKLSPYKKGDVLVLFGELFQRGYANGLVEEAEQRGMTIIHSTVGRREKDGTLRPLNAEEVAAIPQPFINIPIEAGFDLEPAKNNISPVDQIKDVKLSDWEKTQIDWNAIAESNAKGTQRFRTSVANWLHAVESHIPKGAQVCIAHLMAGGVPRTKIVMPLMNRAVKGTGDRYLPSELFWNSQIGLLCQKSFMEVTAETFNHLLELSTDLREKINANGGHVSYLAYGYHGTEVLIGDNYKWQTYTPYLQGWAKIRLEEIADSWYKKGVAACVYNCPEILTNSSSIFQGVEVSLYPLILAMQKECPQSVATKEMLSRCAELLQDPSKNFEEIKKLTYQFMTDPDLVAKTNFNQWPSHSSKAQLEKMLAVSEQLYALHKDEKNLLTAVLSEYVFQACGYLMLHDSYQPKQSTAWIGHDVIAKTLA